MLNNYLINVFNVIGNLSKYNVFYQTTTVARCRLRAKRVRARASCAHSERVARKSTLWAYGEQHAHMRIMRIIYIHAYAIDDICITYFIYLFNLLKIHS